MDFVAGLDLAGRFYAEVVRHLIPVPHAACLLGEGSEVLGFDTPRSRDHEWGPRAQILVGSDDDVRAVAARVEAGLPDEFAGHPVRWYSLATGTVAHHVEVAALTGWVTDALGFDPRAELDTARWLATPQQRLLHVTAGGVFRDDTGELTALRDLLAWYPDDVWRWLLASGWHLVGNAQPLYARCVETDDELGARLLTARLCGLAMELAFLQERTYRPYDKWFGAAFAGLRPAPTITPLLEAALTARPAEAGALVNRALVVLGERHDDLGLTRPTRPRVGPFEVGINDAVRPYQVINAGDFVQALRAAIADPALRATVPVGGIDQLTHADDSVVTHTDWPDLLALVYRDELRRADTGG
ncbi:DUF4037 domain-containing protein [Jiangella asiatica]|uniref:DUF4037 domain-containing protein n=1 Tax=Jiangella asiatica TaxID=2530372 RepID=A0A4R5C808_9ACTN|nr:DUF4037 domain-containing protein [Jiangella asiatica]TDD94263.1 DUF4037 domain-containing protein [Jiangella asiatica]